MNPENRKHVRRINSSKGGLAAAAKMTLSERKARAKARAVRERRDHRLSGDVYEGRGLTGAFPCTSRQWKRNRSSHNSYCVIEKVVITRGCTTLSREESNAQLNNDRASYQRHTYCTGCAIKGLQPRFVGATHCLRSRKCRHPE